LLDEQIALEEEGGCRQKEDDLACGHRQATIALGSPDPTSPEASGSDSSSSAEPSLIPATRGGGLLRSNAADGKTGGGARQARHDREGSCRSGEIPLAD
jgi:hypothetical protein